MKRTLQFLAFIIFCVALLVPSVEARQISRFTSEVTVPIYGKDRAFARNNAFRTLQKQLLEIAIQDLIGEKQFVQFKEYIFRNSFQKPSNYFISVNIINERSRSKSFTMKLEGSLQTDLIRSSLKSLNIVFPSDPWRKVDFLVEKEIPFDFSALQIHFDLFHLKISSIKYFQKSQILITKDLSNDVTPLYKLIENRYGQASAPVIFVVNLNNKPSNGLVSNIDTSVFNRSLSKKVGGFSLDFSSLLTVELLEKKKQQIYKKYVAQFTHDTLKNDFFETKEQNTITLIVMGLNSPFLKDQFQKELLQPNREILSYQVVGMTNNEIKYQIIAKANRFSTFDILEHKSKGSFDFEAVEEKKNQFRVAILSHQKRKAKALSEWVPNNRILDQIRLSQFPQVDDEEVDLDVALDDSLIPFYIEKEPNHHRNNLNSLIPFKRTLGRISSRGDEDLYQLFGIKFEEVQEIPPKEKEPFTEESKLVYTVARSELEEVLLVIDWFQFGKTDLRPQLRIYDENFNFLSQYTFPEKTNRMVIQHDFKGRTPERVYIRISDQIGFIKGETGGYKSFYYLLKYQWKGMKNPFSDVE